MREDLIERLRKLIDDRCGDGPSGPNYDPELLDVLTEAAAALEAAREDSERLDTLDELILYSPERALLLHHGVHKHREPSFWGLGLGNTGRTLRQAIDQARGKGVADEA